MADPQWIAEQLRHSPMRLGFEAPNGTQYYWCRDPRCDDWGDGFHHVHPIEAPACPAG